jgi:hypothetical protein
MERGQYPPPCCRLVVGTRTLKPTAPPGLKRCPEALLSKAEPDNPQLVIGTGQTPKGSGAALGKADYDTESQIGFRMDVGPQLLF